MYSARAQDGPQEMQRNLATAKHVAWPRCAWLLLSFFPYPVGHPEHEHCMKFIYQPNHWKRPSTSQNVTQSRTPCSPFPFPRAFHMKNFLKSHSTRKSRSVIRSLMHYIQEEDEAAAKTTRHHRWRPQPRQHVKTVETEEEENVDITPVVQEAVVAVVVEDESESVAFMPQHNDYEETN